MDHSATKHVVIIDGTQSRIETGSETNAGILYKLLRENSACQECSIYYDPGIQGHGLWNWMTLASGYGLNQSIERAYAHLCQNYKPGQKIYMFGFSRGAYAVRSLAGMIHKLGLLPHSHAALSQVREAYCLYENQALQETIDAYRARAGSLSVPVEMVGAWDTVKALGLPYPGISYFARMATEFHDHTISETIRNGYHALAADENRIAFRPVMWQAPPGYSGHLEQVWFKGCHADIGGHVWGHTYARPLSNIPLVWMLHKAEKHGLDLPPDWEARFPCDVQAKPVGNTTGIARFFLFRKPRRIGRLPSERMHPSTSLLSNATKPPIPGAGSTKNTWRTPKPLPR